MKSRRTNARKRDRKKIRNKITIQQKSCDRQLGREKRGERIQIFGFFRRRIDTENEFINKNHHLFTHTDTFIGLATVFFCPIPFSIGNRNRKCVRVREWDSMKEEKMTVGWNIRLIVSVLHFKAIDQSMKCSFESIFSSLSLSLSRPTHPLIGGGNDRNSDSFFSFWQLLRNIYEPSKVFIWFFRARARAKTTEKLKKFSREFMRSHFRDRTEGTPKREHRNCLVGYARRS